MQFATIKLTMYFPKYQLLIQYSESYFTCHLFRNIADVTLINIQHMKIYEPRHDKMCLREFPTRPDTKRPAQQLKLARVLKFWL